MLKLLRHKREPEFFQVSTYRKIAYYEYGDKKGYPVFLFHGIPGSSLEGIFTHEEGLKHNFRIIAADRPGIGFSDYYKNRTVTDWADDVDKLSDFLGIEKFGVIGVSGGSPYAFACASELKEKVEFVVIKAGWVPPEIYLKVFRELSFSDKLSAVFALYIPFLMPLPYFAIDVFSKNFPDYFWKILKPVLSVSDRNALADKEISEIALLDIRETFRQGVKGPAEDAVLCYSNWGFSLENIKVPVYIFHGTDDLIVPFKLSELLAEKISNSILYNYPKQGHYYLLTQFEHVFGVLKDSFFE